mmetsp:Transcript_131831/g.409836  ORF Transcript_131831/g.409836 Transcript_131831/m.409836 type:complete len:521 (+) Transcript_131831:205-1767(+)
MAPQRLWPVHWDDDLSSLQGRWIHSLNAMGLLTVFYDVVFFDRGTGLRLGRGADGVLNCDGWRLCSSLSSWHVAVWIRAPETNNAWGAEGWRDVDDLTLQAIERALHCQDLGARREKLVKLGVYAWHRPQPLQWYYLDRFSKIEEPNMPERVSLFVIPPPVTMPEGARPWRILVYGGCLSIGWPSGDPYARGMVEELGEAGIFAEVVGCGIANHTSDELVAQAWSGDIRDKFGLRGEGIAHMVQHRGPFDFALIMAGTPDVVKGGNGAAVFELHKACHDQGLRTVALSVPPSWHDKPTALTEEELKRVQRFNEALGFTKAEIIASKKAQLNSGLRSLARPSSGGEPAAAQCIFFIETGELITCSSQYRGFWEQTDWLHLTGHGSTHMGKGVARCLRPLLGLYPQKARVVPKGEAAASKSIAPRTASGGPTAYRVVHGTLLRKEDPRSSEAAANKVCMSKREIDSLVHTTGVTWTGVKGTTWAELDAKHDKKGGWLALNGQCFGIKSDLLRPESTLDALDG